MGPSVIGTKWSVLNEEKTGSTCSSGSDSGSSARYGYTRTSEKTPPANESRLDPENPDNGGLRRQVQDFRMDRHLKMSRMSPDDNGNVSGTGPGYAGGSVVRVQNGCKSYGSDIILNQLNMNVEKGTIYALLGASGCGKTTLLSCIVGTRSLEMGDIFFCGESMDNIIKNGGLRNRVGYMPQELALYKEFTIKEALLYFGRIFGLSNTYITQQTQFLIKFLQLPSGDSLIRQLSGGQQRRTSFAAALLHAPQLLVLDEPTVGVDPILRRSIWEHLRNLVNLGKTTVIITTHYIEEARNADTVGMMRSGRILTEGAPAALLETHKCPNLEELFLSLSLVDETETAGVGHLAIKPVAAKSGDKMEKLAKVGRTLRSTFTPHDCCWSAAQRAAYFNRLRALILKNILTTYRQSAYIFSFLMLPAIEVLLSCWAIGHEPQNLKFGVINLEVMDMNSEMPYAYTHAGAGRGACDPYLTNRSCENFRLGCDYIDALEKSPTFNIQHYTSYEDAVKATESGDSWGFLTIPANFTTLSLEKTLAGLYADNETVFNSRVQVDMDMSNVFTATTIQGKLFETFRDLMKAMVIECEPTYVPEVIDGPLLFNEPMYGKHESKETVTEFIITGLVLLVMYFAAISITGMSYVLEKKHGMLERTIVAGVSTTEIITAQLLTQYIIVIIQIIICLFVVFGAFGVPVNSQLGFIVLLILLQGSLGMLAGIALSSICDEETVVMQVSIAITIPSVILGGIFWPLSGMPLIAQYIAVIFVPQTVANESFRSMLIRNWGITHPTVWPGFAISVAWLIFLWIVAIVFAKRSVSPSKR